ncbi:MAG TPA: hypothetical protein VIL09_13085 [Microvirga sp.]
MLGVYLLPLTCFAVDYVVEGAIFVFYPFSFWLFAVSGMIAFRLSFHVMSAASQSRLRAALVTTSVGAFLTGLILSPISLFAILIYGIGLLGFVPFLTSVLLHRRAAQLPRGNISHVVVGALYVLIPSFGMLAIELTGEWRRQQDVISGQPDRVLKALSQTAIYTPRDLIASPQDRMANTMCIHLDSIPLHVRDVEVAARAVLGNQDEPLNEVCFVRLND